jgi:hypothetical protein
MGKAADCSNWITLNERKLNYPAFKEEEAQLLEYLLEGFRAPNPKP